VRDRADDRKCGHWPVDAAMRTFQSGAMPSPPHLHHAGFALGSAPTMLMLITCRLALDEDGCVHSASSGADGEGIGLVWPDDHAVRTGEPGTFEIVDSNGEVSAREGDTITAGGGFGAGEFPSECAARYAEYLVIGTSVRKVDQDRPM
jgi:hypothetical protein